MNGILKAAGWVTGALALPGTLAGLGMPAVSAILTVVIVPAGVLCWVLADEQRSTRAVWLLTAGRGRDTSAGPGAPRPRTPPRRSPGRKGRGTRTSGQPPAPLSRLFAAAADPAQPAWATAHLRHPAGLRGQAPTGVIGVSPRRRGGKERGIVSGPHGASDRAAAQRGDARQPLPHSTGGLA